LEGEEHALEELKDLSFAMSNCVPLAADYRS
jgi:leucyl-tRNA synthetase